MTEIQYTTSVTVADHKPLSEISRSPPNMYPQLLTQT